MKSLILAEKPSVGRDIARVLNCNVRKDGYLEGKDYIVTWALGHLVTLADPEIYGDNYKKWQIEDLPIIPKYFKLIVIKKTGKQFNVVRELLNKKDVNELIIATDAGREGELVARWIIEKANVKKPIKRLWISSVTDKAILSGFKNLKDGKLYENLYNSAKARAEADWVVGINATRALTCKYNTQLSCGRVQTPTLFMIYNREEEIKKFVPVDYYGIKAKAKNINFLWRNRLTNDERIYERNKCNDIISKIKGKTGSVVDVIKTNKTSYSPKLYDLTELQRDANKLYDLSAKETLSLVQSLYERHKVLTYPRTDSRYLSSDMVDTIKERLLAIKNSNTNQYVSEILKVAIKGNKNFVDDAKVTDHHAIIPTENRLDVMKVDAKERKIYDLVVKRFLSVLLPPCEYENQVIKIDIGGEIFQTSGNRIIKSGWKAIKMDTIDSIDTDNLEVIKEDIKKGEKLDIQDLKMTEGKTKPPAFFNEASLLSAMENPVKYMQDSSNELKKVIEDTGGIGTVATRADIIEKLFNGFLIEKKGKDIFITGRGKQLLGFVPEDLKSPIMTAKWEKRLKNIEMGKDKKDIFLEEMKLYTRSIIKEIKESSNKFVHDNLTGTRCPECNKFMLEVNGKKGKMYVCQDRECGYRQKIAVFSDSRCPECKKKLSLYGEGDKSIYVCSCGFKEKKKSFDERRKKDNKNLSKKEVQNYLKSQNSKSRKEDINNPMFEALSKLKFDKE